MPIGHYPFKLLPLEQQLPILWVEGQYLATRYEEEDTVGLYHMGTFFCEVYYDNHENRVVRTRTSNSFGCLAEYAPYIDLSDLE